MEWILKIGIAVAIYLSLLAILAVVMEPDLTFRQKALQITFSVLIPVIGPLFVLYFAMHINPLNPAKRFVLYPLGYFIFDRALLSSDREDGLVQGGSENSAPGFSQGNTGDWGGGDGDGGGD